MKEATWLARELNMCGEAITEPRLVGRVLAAWAERRPREEWLVAEMYNQRLLKTKGDVFRKMLDVEMREERLAGSRKGGANGPSRTGSGDAGVQPESTYSGAVSYGNENGNGNGNGFSRKASGGGGGVGGGASVSPPGSVGGSGTPGMKPCVRFGSVSTRAI